MSNPKDTPRVLITGGAGFLGSHLCHRFYDEGFEVIAMDNLITGSLRNIEDLFGKERFTFINHDVTKLVHIGALGLHLAFRFSGEPD